MARHEIDPSRVRHVAAVQRPVINHALVINPQPAAVIGVEAKIIFARFHRGQNTRQRADQSLAGMPAAGEPLFHAKLIAASVRTTAGGRSNPCSQNIPRPIPGRRPRRW